VLGRSHCFRSEQQNRERGQSETTDEHCPVSCAQTAKSTFGDNLPIDELQAANPTAAILPVAVP
jgi:hypothetical protein